MNRREETVKLFKENGNEHVLFVGIDVSKLFHVVCAMDGYGEVLLEPLEIDIYETGFSKLQTALSKVVSFSGIKQVIFGCEPSGHYYLNLMENLKVAYPNAWFRLINPSAVKSARDQAMNRSKTDAIDCLAIAGLLHHGDCYPFTVLEPVYQGIKEYVRFLDRMTKDSTRMKNQIHAYLDEIYPGLESRFTRFTQSKMGYAFLETLPKPFVLKKMSGEDITALFEKAGYLIKPKRAEKFAGAAHEMLLVNRPEIQMKMVILSQLVKSFIQCQKSMKIIEIELETNLKQLPYTDNLREIKGLGTRSIARFIAYLGNPEKFENGGQVVSFAGLVSPQEQSGKMNVLGKPISHKGHKKLRSVLVQSAQIAASNMGYFTAFYNRLVLENHKSPNVAIVAVAGKLAKVMMHMILTGEAFNPPTVINPNQAVTKLSRITSKKLKSLSQNKKQPKSVTQEDIVFTVRV